VDLFRGAICIQPYDRAEYANKLSGITLDALMVGAPVVTLSRTWMAKMVEQFEAGVVIEEPTGKALYGAIQLVRNSYEAYSAKASHAGYVLKSQNQWASLVGLLEKDESRIT
jgi:hypothetical protein